ncbi:hypothetical protein J4731_16265 [Providencia rettgeri]|nr:hypothetical protein [Providencia rettgeri]
MLNIRDIEQGLENLERIPGAKVNIELALVRVFHI